MDNSYFVDGERLFEATCPISAIPSCFGFLSLHLHRLLEVFQKLQRHGLSLAPEGATKFQERLRAVFQRLDAAKGQLDLKGFLEIQNGLVAVYCCCFL